MKKVIAAVLLIAILVTALSVGLAYNFEISQTISEKAWDKFVTGKQATLGDWRCIVTACTKPLVGQVFMASDNTTWGSALYTYPKGGNGAWGVRAYRSNVNNGDLVNWRMRTDNVTTGSATGIIGRWEP